MIVRSRCSCDEALTPSGATKDCLPDAGGVLSQWSALLSTSTVCCAAGNGRNSENSNGHQTKRKRSLRPTTFPSKLVS